MSQAQEVTTRFEERFSAWAQGRPDIRAAMIVGSRARADHPADEWADLDLIVFTRSPERYLSTTEWLDELGEVWVTTRLGSNVAAEPERFALFAGGLTVDFVQTSYQRAKWGVRLHRLLRRFPRLRGLLPKGLASQFALLATLISGMFGRGVRVLVDKDGLLDSMQQVVDLPPSPNPPTQGEFLEVVNGFWWLADRTARRVRCGELYVAISYHHGLVEQILRMTEWHTRAVKGPDCDTWHGGRFLAEWADPRALEGLRQAFGHYDEEDMRRALFATMDLFRWLAAETADRLGYPYPASADERVAEWIGTYLSENTASGQNGGG